MARFQSVLQVLLSLIISGVFFVSSKNLGYEESINPPTFPPAPLGLSKSSRNRGGTEDAVTVPTSRPTDYTKAERSTIVTTHNKFRKVVTPSAANMRALEWDQDLAAMAQGWSDQCIFAHGNPRSTSPFNSVGQNLYIRSTNQKNPRAPGPKIPVTRWNDEGVLYTYANRSCGGQCLHYTQVVWARTTHVGCGKTFCEKATDRKGKTYKNAWIVTCNYGPPGNYNGQHPYLEGEECSKCSNPSTCKGGLCRECDLGSRGCSCELVCENCGQKNTTDGACECSCPKGFLGKNCQKTCENTHRHCGVSPGWPGRRFCNRSPMIPVHCPLMCGVCERADEDYVCNQ